MEPKRWGRCNLYNKDNNTFTLLEKHLTGYAKWNLERRGFGFYDLELKHIKAVYRYEANKYIQRGANILLEINNKTRLLILTT